MNNFFDGRRFYYAAIITDIQLGHVSNLPGVSVEADSVQKKEYELTTVMINFATSFYGQHGMSWNNMAFKSISEWISQHDIYKNKVKIVELSYESSSIGSVVIECYCFNQGCENGTRF